MTSNSANNDIDIRKIISEWVNLYTDDLYNWAMQKTSDSRATEDIVQDTFIAAFNFGEKGHKCTDECKAKK